MAVAARQPETSALALVPDLAAMEARADEWRELWRRTRGAGPFASPAWVIAWARTHAPDRTFAAEVRREGRLEGLLPAFTWKGRAYLAAAGLSDYGEALLAAEDAADGLALVCGAARARGCASLALPQLLQGSPLLEAPVPRGWIDSVTPGEVCSLAPLAGPDGLGAMARPWRRKLDYARRRLAREAPHAYRLATHETLAADLEALETLHARRWAERGEPGVLAAPLTRSFLTTAAPALLDDGLLRLHVLDIEGAPAAALLALHVTSGLHAWITAFEPTHAHYSPGGVLLARAIETAAAEGAREIHFLRGREPYKRHWGAEDQPTFERVLTFA